MLHRGSVRSRAIVLFGLTTLTACASTPGSKDEDDDEPLLLSSNASSGKCGVERWAVKTGADASAATVALQPRDTTIAALGAIPAPNPTTLQNSPRIAPTEFQSVRLTNVTLVKFRLENDSDYHLILTAGNATIIAEIPDPACVHGGPFLAGITRARQAFDAKFTVDTSVGIPTPWQTANIPVTVSGVSFFDVPHGQTGIAPNAIEIHPIMDICFGQDCAGQMGGDFSVSASPATVSSTGPAPATTTLAVTPIGAFAGNVTFAARGVPAGATASFSPNPVAAGASSTLRLTPGTAQPGTYTISVDAKSGALTHTSSVAWTLASATDTAPVAEISTPAANAVVAGTITLAAHATDSDGDAIVKLELYVDGVLVGSGAGSPASTTWDTTAVADGPHTVSATAYDRGNQSGSAAVSVTVKNGAPVPSDLIVNGSFEGGLSGWTLGGAKVPIASTLHPHSGSQALRAGATTYEPLGDSWAYQEVTLPYSISSATLHFWYYATSTDTVDYDWQEADILDASGNVLQEIFHMADNSRIWTEETVDLTEYRGQTIDVYFNTHCDGSYDPTTMWIDDVSLIVDENSPPPPPDVPDAPPPPPPDLPDAPPRELPDAPLPDAPVASGAIQTIFVIVMENQNWSTIKSSSSAPYIRSLLPMASHAEAYMTPPGNHPSEPNYLWLVGGTNFGVTSDSDPSSNHIGSDANLGWLMQRAGIQWKSYQESIAGATCPLSSSGNYAAKHNPFVFFDDLTGRLNASDPTCIAHNRPYSELATDLANGTVGRFNFITPNLCHDMHNSCAPTSNLIKQGDDWLASEVPKILGSRAYQDGGALFIVWDEGTLDSDGPIGMIVLSPYAKGAGYSNHIAYTHSSALRTFEEILGLAPLLGDAAHATSLSDLFRTYP
jgi:hypothetical protein